MKNTIQQLLKSLLLLALVVLLFALGRWSAGGGEAGPEPGAAAAEEAQPTTWTCPMHAQIQLPDPGPCPICGMDLVPLEPGGDDGPRRLSMSPASVELARIATEPVARREVTRPVRMVGKIDFDETAVRSISAWVPGRLERLYVDYTGVRVSQGDHLVSLFSPDLLSAQEELLSARSRLSTTSGEASEFLAESNRRAYAGAREKLLLWGLTEAQVAEIEERGTAEDRVMLTSPTSGVVIEKLVEEGAYVKTGTLVYKIAALEELWVRLDAYEQDLAWLRHGQEIVIEPEALPGEPIEGRISFIDYVVDDRTRTAKVRVNVDNSAGRLKPGMFVRAVAKARVGAGGAVVDRYLAGKWVSPMHPEVVKDGPGACDVCGMDLVPAELLGLVDAGPAPAELPLVVPSSAVLVTGRRAVVYVEVPGVERPTFEGREVVLGPRAGDEYVVLSGLQEGERVVTSGAFRIDSSMQILAKPSMMGMPADSSAVDSPELRIFRASLAPVYEAYLGLQRALAADDEAAAREALGPLAVALEGVSASVLPAAQRELWRGQAARLAGGLAAAGEAADIAALRGVFEPLSLAVLALQREFGHAAPEVRHEAYCPMAFDNRGAAWMQVGDEVLNPYFGAAMLRCGELRETFEPAVGEQAPASTPHDDHDHGSDPPGEDGHEHDPSGDGEARAVGAQEPPSALGRVFQTYLTIQRALAADDGDAARDAFDELRSMVSALASAEGGAQLAGLRRALQALPEGADIERLRQAFGGASVELIALEQELGNPLAIDLRLVHCPMAFDFEGADWLQAEEQVANPYFGDEMLRCGSVERVSEGD